MRCRSVLSAGLSVLMLSSASASDQWPQFRGLEAGAVADDQGRIVRAPVKQAAEPVPKSVGGPQVDTCG